MARIKKPEVNAPALPTTPYVAPTPAAAGAVAIVINADPARPRAARERQLQSSAERKCPVCGADSFSNGMYRPLRSHPLGPRYRYYLCGGKVKHTFKVRQGQ